MGGLCGSGGGGSPAATSQTVTTSNIAPWAQAGVTQLTQAGLQDVFHNYDPTTGVLGAQSGYTPFNANTAQQVGANGQPMNQGMTNAYNAAQSTTAGFTPLQQQSYQAAGNMQAPSQYNTATGLNQMAGQGALGTTGQANMYGQMGAGYGAQAANLAPQAQQYGQNAANIGTQGLNYSAQGSGYGAMGAGYGAQAANLAPQAQQYGQNAANIGMQGLGYGAQGAGYGAMGANAGMGYGQAAQNVGGNASPSVQNYMNPYLSATLAPSLQILNQQYGMQQAANQGAQTQAGAFGGSRGMLQNSLNQQNQLLATNQLVGNAYNQAYNTANQNMQNAASLSMQGAQTGLSGVNAGLSGINAGIQGQQAGLSGLGQASSLYGQGMQGAQTGLSGVNASLAGLNTGIQGQQAGLAGLGQASSLYGQGMQGAQTGLSGVNAQQAGYNAAGAAGNNLSNIGTQQLGAQQSIAGLQNAYGAQQQQQQQNLLNTANQNYSTMQAYPIQQLQQLEGLYTGAPTTTSTANYQAAPSTLSQVAGLGMAGYGLSQLGSGKAKGGRIKESGIDKLSAKNLESFKEGGITGGRMEDDVRRFDVAGKVSAPSTGTPYGIPGLVSSGAFNAQGNNDPTDANAPSPAARAAAWLASLPTAFQNTVEARRTADAIASGRPPSANVNPQYTNSGIYQTAGNAVAPTPTPPAQPAQATAPAGNPMYSLTNQDVTAPGGNPLNMSAPTSAPAQQGAPATGLAAINFGSAPVMPTIPNHFEDLKKEIQGAAPADVEAWTDWKTKRQQELGDLPSIKANQRLDKEESEDKRDKADAFNYALVDAGLGALAGSSPFWNVNVGEGLKAGTANYKQTMKDLKAAAHERDKERTALDNADYALKSGQLDKYENYVSHATDAKNNYNNAKVQAFGSFFNTDMQTAAQIAAEHERSKVTYDLGLAGIRQQQNYTNALINQPPAELRTLQGLKADPSLMKIASEMSLAKRPLTEADALKSWQGSLALQQQHNNDFNSYLTSLGIAPSGGLGGLGATSRQTWGQVNLVH